MGETADRARARSEALHARVEEDRLRMFPPDLLEPWKLMVAEHPWPEGAKPEAGLLPVMGAQAPIYTVALTGLCDTVRGDVRYRTVISGEDRDAVLRSADRFAYYATREF